MRRVGSRLAKLEERALPEGIEEIRERIEREVAESRTPEGIAAAKARRDAIFGVDPRDYEREEQR